jgi:hypothetical protein
LTGICYVGKLDVQVVTSLELKKELNLLLKHWMEPWLDTDFRHFHLLLHENYEYSEQLQYQHLVYGCYKIVQRKLDLKLGLLEAR